MKNTKKHSDIGKQSSQKKLHQHKTRPTHPQDGEDALFLINAEITTTDTPIVGGYEETKEVLPGFSTKLNEWEQGVGTFAVGLETGIVNELSG